MTTSMQNENLRIADASVGLSGLPGGYSASYFDQSPPRLRPGAAITLAIAAVVAVLSFIKIIFS